MPVRCNQSPPTSRKRLDYTRPQFYSLDTTPVATCLFWHMPRPFGVLTYSVVLSRAHERSSRSYGAGVQTFGPEVWGTRNKCALHGFSNNLRFCTTLSVPRNARLSVSDEQLRNQCPLQSTPPHKKNFENNNCSPNASNGFATLPGRVWTYTPPGSSATPYRAHLLRGQLRKSGGSVAVR